MKKIVEVSVTRDSHIVIWSGVERLCDDGLLLLHLSISGNVELNSFGFHALNIIFKFCGGIPQ